MRIERGRRAEDDACAWARAQGLQIVARNYRVKVGEIDLICFDPRTRRLVFVEVRSRDPRLAWDDPVESVGFKKRLKLKRAIEYYLWAEARRVRSLGAREIRVDVLARRGGDWDHRPGIEL